MSEIKQRNRMQNDLIQGLLEREKSRKTFLREAYLSRDRSNEKEAAGEGAGKRHPEQREGSAKALGRAAGLLRDWEWRSRSG